MLTSKSRSVNIIIFYVTVMAQVSLVGRLSVIGSRLYIAYNKDVTERRFWLAQAFPI